MAYAESASYGRIDPPFRQELERQTPEELPYHVVVMANRERYTKSVAPQMFLLDAFATEGEAIEFQYTARKYYEERFFGRSPPIQIIQSSWQRPALLADTENHNSDQAHWELMRKKLIKQFRTNVQKRIRGMETRRMLDTATQEQLGVDQKKLQRAKMARDLKLAKDVPTWHAQYTMQRQGSSLAGAASEGKISAATLQSLERLRISADEQIKKKEASTKERTVAPRPVSPNEVGAVAAPPELNADQRQLIAARMSRENAFSLPDHLFGPGHSNRQYACISSIVDDKGSGEVLFWIHSYHSSVQAAREFAERYLASRFAYEDAFPIEIVRTNFKINFYFMHHPTTRKKVERSTGSTEVNDAMALYGRKNHAEEFNRNDIIKQLNFEKIERK